MFTTFFKELRDAKIPVTLKEYLTLLEALDADCAGRSVGSMNQYPGPVCDKAMSCSSRPGTSSPAMAT